MNTDSKRKDPCPACGNIRDEDEGKNIFGSYDIAWELKDDCQKTPKPITGWVAWHPDQEYHTVCPSFDAGWHLLERQGRGSNRKLLVCEGWRIRPVELRFTDEGEG